MDSSQQQDSKGQDVDPRLARKRVSRACDQCRRRKARCDGQSNCSACRSIGLSCSYGQAVKQARGPAYVAHLESSVASLSKQVEDLEFEAKKRTVAGEEISPPSSSSTAFVGSDSPDQAAQSADSVSSAQSRPSFSLPSSSGPISGHPNSLIDTVTKEPRGKAFGIDLIRQLCNFCYDLPRPGGSQRQESALKIMQALDAPFALDGFPFGGAGHPVLPQKNLLIQWIELAFSEALPLWRFVEKSQVEAILYRVYKTNGTAGEESDRDDLALLYALIALGQRFEITGRMAEERKMQGITYFAAARDAVPLANCERSLSAIQTTLCLALYLKSSSAQTRFHAYVSAAASGALRMGLHEMIPGFPREELVMRQRIWSAIRAMDVYASSALGLPSHFPGVVENATLAGAAQPGIDDELMLADAHYNLAGIVHHSVERLYRERTSIPASGASSFGVPGKSLRETSEELETWASNCSFITVGMGSMNRSASDPNAASLPPLMTLSRSRLLLCYAQYHAQLLLYTPFVHHLAQPSTDRKSEAYAYGAKCVRAALGAVSIAGELQKRYQFNEAYFNAVEVLVYALMVLLVVELGSSDADFLRDAITANREAKELLMNLALQSTAAAECLDALTPLYQNGKRLSLQGDEVLQRPVDELVDYSQAEGIAPTAIDPYMLDNTNRW